LNLWLKIRFSLAKSIYVFYTVFVKQFCFIPCRLSLFNIHVSWIDSFRSFRSYFIFLFKITKLKKGASIIGTKDIATKELLNINRIFADILNGYVYKGQQVIKPEALEDFRTHESYQSDAGVLHNQNRDVAKLYKDEMSIQLAIAGLEHQTSIDRLMPIRIIGYDGASYRQQLTGEWKDGHPIPVITFILYFGIEKKWDMDLSLQDILPIPKAFRKHFQNYGINVINVAWLTDEQIDCFQSDFKILAKVLKHLRLHPEEKYQDEQEIEYAKQLLQVLTEITGDKDYIQYTDTTSDRKEIHNMASLFKNSERYGREQGKADERLRLIQELLRKEMSDDFILSLNYTPEELEKAKTLLQQPVSDSETA